MADLRLRAFVKPAGLTKTDAARLLAALTAAVDRQRELAARSIHVLEFTGTLQETENHYLFEHEPAMPVLPTELFDPARTGMPPADLLSAAAGLLDALRAGLDPAGKRTVHGGICPGVVLRGADGVWKLTDFGIAPAVCSVLGLDPFLNLAVGPGVAAAPPQASGAWQILSPEEYERDDRLCAFVDPEKYRQGTLTTFEAGSDMVALGFVLRLLAEHRHPYLYDPPDSHRSVAMSELMPSLMPMPLMRADLTQSADAAHAALRGLLESMIDAAPGKRPAAAAAAKSLEPHAPRGDVEAALAVRRRRAEEAAAAAMAVRGQQWLATLETALAAREWDALESGLSAKPTLTVWPDGLLERVEEIRRQALEYRAEQRRQATMAADRAAVEAWIAPLRAAAEAEQWEEAERVLAARPAVSFWPEGVKEESEQWAALVRAAIRERQDHRAAAQWIESVQAAAAAAQWTAAADLLARRPMLEYWPKDVQEQASAIEADVRGRMDAIEVDHRAAQGWLEQIRTAVAEQRYEAALDLANAPPELKIWPADAREQAEQLAEQCRDHLGEQVLGSLTARIESARQAAEDFVRMVLQEQFARVLDPRSLSVKVDAVEWRSANPAANGHARLVLTLVDEGQRPRGESVTAGFDFQTDAHPPHICDDGDVLRELLVERLGQDAAALQSSRLAETAPGLSGPYFPKAVLRAPAIEKPVDRLPTELDLLGGDPGGAGRSDAASRVAVELQWDARQARWKPVDAAALRAAASAAAVTAATSAVRARLLSAAPGLSAYQAIVQLELKPRPWEERDGVPSPLALEGRVALRPAGTKELLAIAAITATSAHPGDASIGGDARGIDAALRQALAERQSAQRQAMAEQIQNTLDAARVKAKLTLTPKRIADPVDELGFDVKARAGRAALAARWDAARLEFAPVGDWARELQPLVGPAESDSAPAAAPPAAAPSAAAPSAATSAPAAPPAAKSSAPSAAGAGQAATPPKGKSDKPDPAAVAAKPKRAAGESAAAEKGGKSASAAAAPDAPRPAGDAAPPAAKRRGVVLAAAIGIPLLLAGAGAAVFMSRGSGPQQTTREPPQLAQGNPAEPPDASTNQPPDAGTSRTSPDASTAAPDDASTTAPDASTSAMVEVGKKGDDASTTTADASTNADDASTTGEDATTSNALETPTTVDPTPNLVDDPALADLLAGDSPGLSQLARLVQPDETVALSAAVTAGHAGWKPDESGDRATQSFNAGVLGAETPLRAELSRAAGAAEWTWTWRFERPADLSRAAEELVRLATTEINRLGDSGALASAHERLGAARAALAAAANEAWLQSAGRALPALQPAIPPPWAEAGTRLTGFEPAAQPDQRTGYPVALTAGGAALLLVAVAPADPIWARFAGQKPGWRLFYVDAAERGDTGDAADSKNVVRVGGANGRAIALIDSAELAGAAAARPPARAVPTRTEWLMAALTLHGNPAAQGFAGDAFEWCVDDRADRRGQPLVCGGCSLLGGALEGRLVPPLDAANASADELWAWFNHPLVQQPRRFGDRLTGLRSVLRVYPAESSAAGAP